MGGDYTRFTFKANKNYSGVLKQQGRVSLDSDWNELADIADRKWRSETLDIIGRCAVPVTTPEAFKVMPTGSGTFDIGIGRAYVDGIQTENHGLDPQLYNPILGEEYKTNPVPYSDQPFFPTSLPPSLTAPALPPILGRTDLIYLDVWQREVTVIEDPGIKEIALGGPDTTTRVQTAWQVKAITDVGDASCPDTIARWDDEVRPSGGRLTTSTFVPPPDDNPCIISAAGGYRGIENRLYRVEIHTPGPIGTARFKWSRNNASIVSEVQAIFASADQITVRQIGRDQILRFNVGDWIEITDDHLEFQSQPGHMGQITNIDEANRIITINNTIPGSLNLDPTDATRHTRVRRWDQSSGVDANGLLSVTAGPVDIEDGIQVYFSLDPSIAAGEFKIGDYWVFYARTADGSVEPLVNAPPRGIKHHYCRLAFVTWGADLESTFVRDCRTLWPPARCCPIAVRPGEDIQAAINRAPEEGGCVCLLPGIHRVYRPLLVDGRKNLTITGLGAATKVVFSPTAVEDPALAVLYVVGASRNIVIMGLFVHADALEHLIFIDEASEEIAIDDCILANGLGGTEDGSECILLGQCCKVATANSKLAGSRGIVQAGAEALERARTALSSLRPLPEQEEQVEEGGNEGNEAEEDTDNDDEQAEPIEVSTLQGLHVNSNEILFANIGVELQDVLSGDISKNSFDAITENKLAVFARSVAQTDEAGAAAGDIAPQDFYTALEESLAALSFCPKPTETEGEESEAGEDEKVAEIPERTIGTFACVMEDFDIKDNEITAESGIVLQHSRLTCTVHNNINVSRIGISIDYGFEAGILDNRIRIAVPDDLSEKKEETNIWDALRQRFRAGRLGIGMRFVRGIKIKGNNIDAHSAIASWRRNWKLCKGIRAESLLRVLRIERPWRAVVELAWFFYQIFRLPSVSPATTANETPADADVAKSRKEQFEQRIFEWFTGLLASRYIPYFIGKANIAENRMEVSRFGIFFYKIVSVSGLRILRNRVSGFRKTGILVHPWFSVGLVDQLARALRCLLTWFVAFITMLRDGLRDLLEGTTPSERPAAGIAGGILGFMAQGISWILILCSRYCAGSAAPEDEGEEDEEEQPPSLAEILKDALDDFLDHVNFAWLDDLVNQSYDIDKNVVAGAGDGIWTGLDTSRITNNKVTIWPASTVPYETVIFGMLLKNNFENVDSPYYTDTVDMLATSMIELERDMLFFAGLVESLDGWLNEHINDEAFQVQLRGFLSQLAAHIDPESELADPITEMQDGLNEENLDLDKVSRAWSAAFVVMIRDIMGYGIAMMGANMVCRGNRVVSQTGCIIPFVTQKRAMTNRAILQPGISVLPGGRQLIFKAPAIAGIWQFSNFTSLLIDVLALATVGKEDKRRLYCYVVALIALFALLLTRERTLCVAENSVEDALVHGIRTLPVAGLDEVDIYDNSVRDASRHGIYHASGIFGMFDEDIHVKVHRNTVNRAEGASAFGNVQGADGDFSSLFWIDNEEGTTLMSQNHGDDEGLGGQGSRAVWVESDVVGVIANHILTSAASAFEIDAIKGLFTDNMTNQTNNISPAAIVQGPDVDNL